MNTMDCRMDYEWLLRAAYYSDRDPSRGINADCFDGLVSKEIDYKNALETSKGIAAYKFGIKVGEISTQINLAIDKMIRETRLSDEQIKQLKNCKLHLIEPSPDLDVDKIIDVIAQVKRIIVF